jgi:hypothetical protein
VLPGGIVEALDKAEDHFDWTGKECRLTGTAVYHIVGRLGAKVGLTVRPHELRHVAITTALDRTNGDVRRYVALMDGCR